MAKNEKTGSRVAAIASRLLASDAHKKSLLVALTRQEFKALRVISGDYEVFESFGTVGEMKSLAASALTQTADHAPIEKKAKKKKK